jgi:DNA-binding NarL/FixJ family response regulator
LTDDHAVVRRGLRKVLDADPRIKVVGEAQNGREAVKMAHRLKPDVILMDIAMPVLNGLEATRLILAANPKACVVMLSAYSDDAYIERMSAIGAVGFLEKTTAAELLPEAIRAVIQGQLFFSPAIGRRMARGSNWSRDRDGALKPDGVRLTARETEILKLVAHGQTNPQIAAILRLPLATVKRHRQHALERLNLHESADLVRYALARGIIENKVELKVI